MPNPPLGYEFQVCVLRPASATMYAAGLRVLAVCGTEGWRGVGIACDPDGALHVLLERDRRGPPANSPRPAPFAS